MENTSTVETAAPKKAETAVQKARETYERFVQKLSTDLKEAGKGGKKQWEDAVKSTRELLAKAKPPLNRAEIEKVGATVKSDVKKALLTIQERGDAWTSSERFLTARDKGAQLILKLAKRARELAASVETNLEATLKDRKPAA